MFICLRRIAIVAIFIGSFLPLAKAQSLSHAASAGTGHSGEVDGDSFLRAKPWEYGVFANGGFGVEDRSGYKFLSLGIHAGKVLTAPIGEGFWRGQFEYAAELMPLWQAYTPRFRRVNCYLEGDSSVTCTGPFYTGGTYTGLSITPIILRWDFHKSGKWMPWVQGAGGMVWTNHKFPPLGPVPAPGHLGASVFNFTPQFGLGVQYFVRPRQSISLGANAVHISSASLGDSNPGVNASVQFSVGYTWWK